MIHEFGVRAGRISSNRMVELLSTNPDEALRPVPAEGTIAPGSDADIVIFDPEKRHLITAETQQSRTDYNLYEGTEVTGSPETVLLAVRCSSTRVSSSPSQGSASSSSAQRSGRSSCPLRHADETKRGGAPDTFPPCPAPAAL